MASTKNPPVLQPGIVEETVEKLTEIVLQMDTENGSLPSQSDLAQELGISRTAIREAMLILQARGLIEIRQGKRPQILPVSNSILIEHLKLFMARRGATFHELMEVRLPLEVEVARFAAERATSDHIEALDAAIQRLKSAKHLRDQVEADRDFHVGLAQATHNPLFVAILESFHFGLQSSMKSTIGNVGIQHAVRGHQSIVDAICKRQATLAAERMQQHLQQAIEDYYPRAKRTRS